MADAFEFLSPTDKPALLAINNAEWIPLLKTILLEMGYKVHQVEDHAQFPGRFAEVQYQIVVIDEAFGATPPDQNITLQSLQRMPMAQRRHTVIFLIGAQFETLNAMQGFHQSVHAVINYSELALFGQIALKVVADNDLFLSRFRDAQQRVAQSRG